MPSADEVNAHRVFFVPPPWPQLGATVVLSTEESRHALRAMRVRSGDAVRLVDGSGSAAIGRAEAVRGSRLRVRLERREPGEPPGPQPFALALPPIKSATRLDWAIEKGTELGVRAFHLFLAERSVKRFIRRTEERRERWRRVARAAMKQSGRAWWPTVALHESLAAMLAGADAGEIWLADRDGPTQIAPRAAGAGSDMLLLLVGPEGGFSPEELTLLTGPAVRRVALGPHRLRVETAAIALCTRCATQTGGKSSDASEAGGHRGDG